MTRLLTALRNRRLRQVAAVFIITVTFGLFGYYLATHPKALQVIASLDPLTLLLLTAAYLMTVAANAFVLFVSLRLIGHRVGYGENLLLTGYSSIVNFFGPLQSGPGFRAAYLKQKHKVSLKHFFSVTLIFYGFFALINGGVLGIAILTRASGLIAGLIMLSVAVVAILAAVIALKNNRIRTAIASLKLTESNFWLIGAGAGILSLATAAAYYVELLHVDASVSIIQALTYTAAANLALFVSLTPGAIGFRESFLLLSQQLHGVAQSSVIAASIIDRAFYVVFLLVLFVILLLFGLRRRLSVT